MAANNTLAIVIPAFKAKFLDTALASIAVQTNKNFTLYVCDDASKEDIKAITEKYRNDINLHYHRFANNMGGKDLVEQWNRSVALADAEWIWLFSDDDVLSPNSVQLFFDALHETKGKYSLYRFNIEMINAGGEVICIKEPHPQEETAYQFLIRRLQSKSLSAAVEYIFKKETFNQNKGFVNLPAAWCADDASWVQFAGTGLIYTIQPDVVYWRSSGINISSSTGMHRQKISAMLKYLAWVKNRYNKLPVYELENWFFEVLNYVIGKLSLPEKFTLSKNLAAVLGKSRALYLKRLLFNGSF